MAVNHLLFTVLCADLFYCYLVLYSLRKWTTVLKQQVTTVSENTESIQLTHLD